MEDFFNDDEDYGTDFENDSNEQVENEEDISLKESNFELYLQLLQHILNRYEIREREHTVELTKDADGEPSINNTLETYFEEFNDYLAELHAQGQYNAIVDTGEIHYSLRDDVRSQMASIDDNIEIDRVVTDTANHTLNMVNAVMEQSGGKEFSECQFTDKDGNPLKFDFSNENYQNTIEAIQYGIDHGTVNCILPNGKQFEAPADGYVAKLDYYDSMNCQRLQYLADMENNTREKFENLSESERLALVPDYVDDEFKQQYLSDVARGIDKDQANYQKLSEAYDKGNPYEDIISQARTHGGFDFDAKKQATLNNAATFATKSSNNEYENSLKPKKGNNDKDLETKIYQKVDKEDNRGIPYSIYTGKIDGVDAQLFSSIHVNRGQFTYDLTDDDIKQIWDDHGSISFTDDKGAEHEVHMGVAIDQKTGNKIYKTSIDGSIDNPTPEMDEKRAAYEATKETPLSEEKDKEPEDMKDLSINSFSVDEEKDMDKLIKSVASYGAEIEAKSQVENDFSYGDIVI